MKRLKATKAREDFSDTINKVAYGKERIILERHGKDIAAIIPMEDLTLLERLIEKLEDLMDMEEAKKALADPENKNPIPLGKVKEELEL